MNIKLPPAILGEGTAKEQVERSFFPAQGAENTGVVIIVNLEIFSPDDISGVQPVHKEQPGENSDFVTTFRLP